MVTKIAIKDITKSFNSHLILNNLNLNISKGKITAFFGPNGCGKSTLFNILSGLVKQDSGELNFKTKNNKKELNYMFQNYQESLLPWRTNYENLSLPLEVKGKDSKVIKTNISNLTTKYNFGIDLESYPYELSGGQKQFLAFLRTIITKPNILLLDEPFSSIDYENSFKLANKLQDYYLENKPTILVITHNIEEAVFLADEIIILSGKPAKVIGKIKNPLLYPRTIEVLKTEKFNEIKNKALKIFQSEVNL